MRCLDTPRASSLHLTYLYIESQRICRRAISVYTYLECVATAVRTGEPAKYIYKKKLQNATLYKVNRFGIKTSTLNSR